MWRLAEKIATWQSGEFQASIDVQHPEEGLGTVTFQEHTLPVMALLQVQPAVAVGGPMALEDCYVRKTDLIATYLDPGRRVHLETLWRVYSGRDDQAGTMLETLVSVRTDLPDTDPMVNVQCRMLAKTCEVIQEPNVPAAQVFSREQQFPERIAINWDPPGCGLAFQLEESQLVVAQLLHGADVVSVHLQQDTVNQTMTSTVSFFRGRMEKGVIRRARLRVIVVPDDQAARALREQWCDMQAAPPPLAT